MLEVVGLSGGKDSTALALRLHETEPNPDRVYLCTPTGNELEEMKSHWDHLEDLLDAPLIRLQPFSGDGLLYLIEQQEALPNWRQRWCTRMLKIEPTITFLKSRAPCVQLVGLRADEEEREGIYGDIPGVQQRYPLREWGWGIEDVIDYLAARGVRVPRRTDCAWCYGQRLIEWKRLWEAHPEVYEKAVQLEAATGHTFRSPARDSWPAGLAELRTLFEGGKLVKGEKPKSPFRQLDLWEGGEDEDRACRVCSL